MGQQNRNKNEEKIQLLVEEKTDTVSAWRLYLFSFPPLFYYLVEVTHEL